MVASVKKRNPMTTRNDRVRLKPLNVTQLNELLTSSTKKRLKGKIQRRLLALVKRDK